MILAAPAWVVDVGIYCASTTAAFGLLAMLWRWKWFHRIFVDPVYHAADERRAARTAEVLEEMLPQYLAPILAELRPNGGSSFRDEVNRFMEYQKDRNHEMMGSLQVVSGMARLNAEHINEIRDTLSDLAPHDRRHGDP